MLFIIKPNQHDDFFVAWSTINAAPEAWGSRADLLGARTGDDPTLWQQRLDDADATSNSASWPARSWDLDHDVQFRNLGTVRRSQLRTLIETLDSDGRPTASTLALISMDTRAAA